MTDEDRISVLAAALLASASYQAHAAKMGGTPLNVAGDTVMKAFTTLLPRVRETVASLRRED